MGFRVKVESIRPRASRLHLVYISLAGTCETCTIDIDVVPEHSPNTLFVRHFPRKIGEALKVRERMVGI